MMMMMIMMMTMLMMMMPESNCFSLYPGGHSSVALQPPGEHGWGRDSGAGAHPAHQAGHDVPRQHGQPRPAQLQTGEYHRYHTSYTAHWGMIMCHL